MKVPRNLTPSRLLQHPRLHPLPLVPSRPLQRYRQFQILLKSTVREIDHPTIHTLHNLNIMNALGTHHPDLTTQMTDTLHADSTHATVPIRPTTTVTIRLHASVHLRISLTLAHLALTTLNSLRHTVVTGTIPHPRETFALPPPLIPNSIPLQLHTTHPQW